MRSCPECKVTFNVNDKDSTYQVNDNFELTFCSYSCSAKYTDDRVEQLYKSGLSVQEIKEGI